MEQRGRGGRLGAGGFPALLRGILFGEPPGSRVFEIFEQIAHALNYAARTSAFAGIFTPALAGACVDKYALA